MESTPVLLLTPVTNLVVTEHPLDVSEGMLHFRANLALELLHLRRITVRVHLFALARPFSDVPGDLAISMGITFFNTSVSGITEHASFLAVQQPVSHFEIVGIGSSGVQAVNDTGQIIYAN